MTSEALKNLWVVGERLKTGIDKYKDKEIAIEKYALALTFNTFSAPERQIRIPGFNKGRTMLSESEIPLAEEKARAMIATIRDEENREKEKPRPVLPDEAAVMQEADRVYHEGKAIDYLKDTFREYWFGDEQILVWVAIQHVNSWLANPEIGIHLHVTGPSNTGKSESVKAAMRLLPDEHRVIGSFTRRGVIYKMKELHPGTTILHDDHIADEDEMELNRAILAAWDEGYDYNSVVDGETHTIRIPPRINRVVTNVANVSSELSQGQDDSRFVTLEMYRDEDAGRRICAFVQEEHQIPESRIAVCKQIFRHVAATTPRVTIPVFGPEDIRDPRQIRRLKQERTTLKAITALNGREVATDEDVRLSRAYLTYTRQMLSAEIPGLNRNEKIVYQAIYRYMGNGSRHSEMDLDELKNQITGMPSTSFYEALRGRDGRFDNPTGGILASIPGLHITDGEYDEIKRKYRKVLIFAGGLIKNPDAIS